ncbi:uncharacterized protein LTR77_001935 [Saxophila tyrrhenica]|uniref:Uncharacterized protein n=1 Tax=Saxophila tyrrhenica TaxID=1690608 RepID=A0AAV9PHM7_9PEZI|nr:hypothetical protein LTR77_001935 [Saxophila tyrrhenica]
MLFSRLAEYTRMMADGKQLPPFIYPPCWLDGAARCSAGAEHRCLSGDLETCSSLIKEVHSARPELRGAAWQRIVAHLKQVYEEHHEYNEERTLEAMQAALLYGLLGAQQAASVSYVDVAWVVEMIEAFGHRLFDMTAWDHEVDLAYLSRPQWVLVESMRRIGCVLYLFDLLLHSNATTPSTGECETFFNMPLPCSRNLWIAASEAQWQAGYQSVQARRCNQHQLILGELLTFRRSPPSEEPTKITAPGMEEALAEWCEHADDLSMLLWMAGAVDGDGQAPALVRGEVDAGAGLHPDGPIFE